MMTEYLYSISGDITGQSVNVDTLHKTISNTLDLSTSGAIFNGLVVKEDDLIVIFDIAIDSSEKTALDLIILNHNSSFVPLKTRNISVYPFITQTSNIYYTTVGSFIYNGSLNTYSFTEIQFVGSMDAGALSYDVEIVNKLNNSSIALQNFTNTTLQTQTFSTINYNNIPQQISFIDILVKINTSDNNTNVFNQKSVHIGQFVFWLD